MPETQISKSVLTRDIWTTDEPLNKFEDLSVHFTLISNYLTMKNSLTNPHPPFVKT
jgi:hypothetical protein